MKRFLEWAGTGFGLGYSPFAPGTVGCLLGLPLVWAINSHFGVPGQIAWAIALTLLAIPLSQAVEDKLKNKDPKPCVADEYLTFPICMIGLPVWDHPHGLVVMAVAFVTNRFFDIAKFWPANGLQRLKGGVGIVIDDVFAALYALAVNHALYRAALHFGWL
ncbi:MAG TPA: phosphatidylglycerophosphatase A [Kiritimatiellia bacterium]|nr:phosphatidylglycerophosphatase A [Kiritimatiellia bacterium]